MRKSSESERGQKPKRSWTVGFWQIVFALIAVGVLNTAMKWCGKAVTRSASEEVARKAQAGLSAFRVVADTIASGGATAALASDTRADFLAATRMELTMTVYDLDDGSSATSSSAPWTEADLASLDALVAARGPGRDLHVTEIADALRRQDSTTALGLVKQGVAELAASPSK